MFFKKNNNLEEKVIELRDYIDLLKEEKSSLKEELEDLRLKKKIEEEDIRHMVQITAEKKDLEVERKKLDLEREKESAIATVKDKYRDKTEQQLERQITDMQKMYGEILDRLPNYNVDHLVKEKR